MNTKTELKTLVAEMRLSPTVYINRDARVVFTVERQSVVPRVLRLIRRDLDSVDDTLDNLDAGMVAVDTYESFAITYGLPAPILSASFGHRLHRDGGKVIDIDPRRRGGMLRGIALQLRSGVMTVPEDEQRTLIDQIQGSEPDHLAELRTAQYVAAVKAALKAGVPLPTGDVCPECGSVVAGYDGDHHVWKAPDGRVVVLVGCEGYFVINPNLVGVDSPNWQPTEEE